MLPGPRLFLVGVSGVSYFLLGCVELPRCFLLGCVEIPGCSLGDVWRFLAVSCWMRGVGPGPISLPRPEAEVLPVSLISTFLRAQLGSLVQEPCLSRVTTSDMFSLQTRSAAPSPVVSSGQQHHHRVQLSRGTSLEGTES